VNLCAFVAASGVVLLVSIAFGTTQTTPSRSSTSAYPPAAMAQFKAGCEHEGASADYCDCFVVEVETNVPWPTFTAVIGEEERGESVTMPAAMVRDITSCKTQAVA
jgi:hypothetical protein